MDIVSQLVCLPVDVDKRERRRMSGARLSGAAQVRYLLQWFEEWSELQRQDFLPLLAERLRRPARGADALAAALAAVDCRAKPMSLFQCRIKLFNEWYPTWGEEERSRLVQGIASTDPAFAAKLDSAQAALNGFANGDRDDEAETSPEPHLAGEDAAQSETSPETQAEAAEPARDEQAAPESLRESQQESAAPLEIAATS